MSFKEKIRLRLPAYLIFSFLAFLGVISLWLPRFINERIENAQALTYSTTSTLFSVPQDSKNKMIAVGNTFYLVYTSSTYAGTTSTCGPAGSCNLYITTSTNGSSWNAPRLVASGLNMGIGNSESAVIGDLAYNTRQGYLAVLYVANSDKKLYVATSTNGVTWTSTVVVSSNGAGLGVPSSVASIAFATNTDLAAVTVRNGSKIILTTTTNPLLSVWPTSSTIQDVTFTGTGTGYNSEAYGTAIEGSAGAFTIHTIIATATTSPGYCINHYKTTNLGVNWTTSSIHSCTSPADANVLGNELQRNSATVDRLGHPALLYYVTTGLNMGNLTVTTSIKSAQLSVDGSTWTTTTLAQGVGHAISFSFPFLQGGAVYTYNNTNPIMFFSGTSTNPYLSINTSTFITERVNTGGLNYQSRASVSLNTSSQVLGMAYVSGYQLRFVTSTLRDISWNVAPTSTNITPVFATSGTGYVTVTTTISDSEADTATVYIDHSLDGGTTWASSTLVTASAQTGSVSTAVGRVTGVLTASANPISFTWDSKADGVTATTTAMIRIAGGDVYTFGNYRMSATFTVDNVPLSAPASQTISVSTSSASFSWADVSGAGAYTVSSTAGAASTTLSTVTTTAYTGLTPNTLYSFQVRTIDGYSNTGTFSSASSTYTDPVAISAAPTAGSATESSLTVTWADGVNGSGSVYQLYNLTTSAVVATTTATSYSVTGLTAATSYQFQVRVQYLSSSTQFTDYSTASTAVSTSAASSNSSGSSNPSGSAASAPAAPSVPAPVPVTPQASETNTFVVGAPQPLTIGGASHTVLVQRASDAQATVEVRSNPIVLTLNKGAKQAIDTDEDGIKDVLVAYAGIVGGKPQFTFTNLTDVSQTKSAFTINAGAYETDTQQVRLDFNVPGAIQVAVSNDASFAAAEFKSYQKNVTWQLPAGQGVKTLYVRFRTNNGGIASVQDSITLTTSGYSPVVTAPVSPDTSVNLPVSYQFTKNLYVGARGADVTALQNRLKSLGYLTETPTGYYGNATVAAVKKFQAANKVSQTGGVGPATRAVLNQNKAATEAVEVVPTTNNDEVYQFTKNLYVGARGADVTALQNRLKSLGYLTETPTGYYGNATVAAVKKFQAANKVSQTGGVGPATRAVLNR